MKRVILLGLSLSAGLWPATATAQTATNPGPVVVPPMFILPPPPPPPGPPRLVVVPPAAPPVAVLPQPVRAMIEAAFEEGNQTAIDAVIRYARKSNPDANAQIDALAAEGNARIAEQKAREARVKADQLASAALLDNWKGEIEAGGSRSTGNTSNLGLFGQIKLNREGPRWRLGLSGRTDYQRTDGRKTADRTIAAIQPYYKFDDRLYAYGIGQYERDPFLGYWSRYTAGAGIGYSIVTHPELKIDFEGGPAVRYINYTDEPTETTAAGRASLAVRWKLTPTLQFNQDAALYVESGNTNASATTSLDTRLIGALKARFTYNITFEKDPPFGRESLDTLSRATLVYSF